MKKKPAFRLLMMPFLCFLSAQSYLSYGLAFDKNPQNFAKDNTKTASQSQEIRNVSPFSGISTSEGIEVRFSQGSGHQVTVKADDNIIKYVSTVVKDNVLHIEIEGNGGNGVKINTKNRIIVDIIAANLDYIKTSSGASFIGAGSIHTNSLKLDCSSGSNVDVNVQATDAIDLKASSAAKIKMKLQTQKINIGLSGAAVGDLSGQAKNGKFSLSSAAVCNAQNLILESAMADASSASSLKINVNKDITAKASSAGRISYIGNPTSKDIRNEDITGSVIKKED